MREIIDWREKSSVLRYVNGLDFISHEMVVWVSQEQITLLYISADKLAKKAGIECFNRIVRQGWLELNWFEDIEHAQLLVTQWQWTYNNVWPHSAIGAVTP